MKKQITEKSNKNKGITLIALVITIIVMLVLVAVTISMAVNGGLFNYAGRATGETDNAIQDEQQLASGKVTIDNKVYNSIDEYLNGGATNPEEPAIPETDAKYFEFTFDEATQTAILTGIKTEYMVTYTLFDDYYREYSKKEPAYIRDGENEIKDIVIPSKVVKDGITYTITGIGGSAFKCKDVESEITSITLPNSITDIRENAFYGCSSLSNIIIPSNVSYVGSSAFHNTGWYNNQPDGDIYIGKVYYKYKGTIPENTSIEIMNETKYICASAFSNQSNLKNIIIPNSVTRIGNYAFYNCTGLNINITHLNNVTSIGDDAFYGCTGIIEEYETGIGTLVNKSGITNLVIESGIIEDWAFSGCWNLENVTMLNNVTRIENSAFNSCDRLTSIIIPYSVEYVGSNIFGRCPSLLDVYCARTQEEASGWNGNWAYLDEYGNESFEIHWGSTGPASE